MRKLEGADLFKTHYQISLKPYTGLDFSKKCFVFPGQGASFPGMGKAELQRFEILQQRFQAADSQARAMGIPAPSLYIEDPDAIVAGQLSLVRNLALFTLSLGLFEVLIALGEHPKLLTSHSFGEYAAFVASGILSFEEMFRIVAEREKICPAPRSLGSMIAVSSDAESLKKLSGLDPRYFANFNSPQQTVLSVPADKVKDISSLLKKNRISSKVLEAVPQPYHSFLMEESAKKLEKFLVSSKLSFRSPRIPVISSVTGEVLTEENFSAKAAVQILSQQLVSPVQFISQIQKAYGMGFRHFIEIAVNRIGSQWIDAILKDQPHKISFPKALQVESQPEQKKQIRRDHDSKLVSLLNKVVSSVTGYSVSEISLSKNFQEDLGIDSIKKAQIVLNFLESQGDGSGSLKDGILMNQIRTIEDVLTWYTNPKEKKGAAAAASFSLYRREWVDAPLTNADFAVPTGKNLWISIQEASRAFPADIESYGSAIFYDDHTPFDFMTGLKGFRQAYDGLRKLPSAFLFACVTDDSSVTDVRGVDGFLRSLSKETSTDFQSFYFDHFNPADKKTMVEREIGLPLLPAVSFEGQRRKVLRYEAFSASTADKKGIPQSVLGIGGASGVTFEMLKALARAGTKKVFVLGRRGEDEVHENLGELKELGVELQYVSGDSTRREDLEKVLKMAGINLDLVLHGGGYEFSATLANQTDDQAKKQLDIKIQTTRLLKELAVKYRIKKTICFASTAGEFGNVGQSIYAYANQVMVRECELAQKENLDFATVSWPAWDRLGMTEKKEIDQQLRLTGLHLLETANGADLFLELLASPADKRSVCMDVRYKYNETEKARTRSLQTLLPGQAALHFPITLERWTLRDLPALHDHIIMDQSLMPISFALTFLWHLSILMKGYAVKLQNLTALSFMVLHRRDSPYSLDHFLGKSGESFEIRSNQPHIQAQVAEVIGDDLRFPVYQEPAGMRTIDMFKQAYSLFGKRLHLLENVRVTSDDRAFASVDCAKHNLYPDCDSVNRQLILLEALFHLSGACSDTKTGRVSVPLSVESFVVSDIAAAGDKFKLMVQCRYPHADIIEADLYAYNEKGEVFLAVRGERLRLFAEVAEGPRG